MSSARFAFTINGQAIEIETVWAHLKRATGLECDNYYLSVPLEIAPIVFGEQDASAHSWAARVHRNVLECGTFVVDGYLSALTKLMMGKRGPFKWVLTSVDKVCEESGSICLMGKAQRFDAKRELPNLKPLR